MGVVMMFKYGNSSASLHHLIRKKMKKSMFPKPKKMPFTSSANSLFFIGKQKKLMQTAFQTKIQNCISEKTRKKIVFLSCKKVVKTQFLGVVEFPSIFLIQFFKVVGFPSNFLIQFFKLVEFLPIFEVLSRMLGDSATGLF